ncbi:Acylamidase [Sulfitobacter sp. DSM 110093]|uniref:amidase n=1 Tax=Sulfitobacter sp. DSM 110093 TaxID=2883127 RepID=UPI001FAE5CAE|nr:amidase [Sulfitobacter sp. DSM 110093]UOA32920.1 Acylamidase [Sulfitobacter sp. DSM 110093]
MSNLAIMLHGDELWRLPATELIRLYRARDLSPVEVVKAQIRQAELVEPMINAFTETFFDAALLQARDAEARYAGRGEIRPLEGLTVAIKDVYDQRGARTTRGSKVIDARQAGRDHPVVRRIRDAGGILHARTTTSEFAMGWITATKAWGVTRNPWNTEITPGGSSGGSAASIASGTSTLAIGGDSAGSVRVPAAMCGIVGYKPPHGRVPDPDEGHDVYSVVGPMGQTVGDCALLLNVISGCDGEDIHSLREMVEVPLVFPQSPVPRFAVSFDLGKTLPSSEIQAVLDKALKQLQACGAVLSQSSVEWPEDLSVAAQNHAAIMLGTDIAQYFPNRSEELSAYLLWQKDQLERVDLSSLARGRNCAGLLYSRLEPILSTHDALLCPTTLVNDVGAEQMPWELMSVNGANLNSDYDWVTTYAFNMLGQLPVLTVPVGRTANGIPVGLQVVAQSFDDLRAFRAAAFIERVMQFT